MSAMWISVIITFKMKWYTKSDLGLVYTDTNMQYLETSFKPSQIRLYRNPLSLTSEKMKTQLHFPYAADRWLSFKKR